MQETTDFMDVSRIDLTDKRFQIRYLPLQNARLPQTIGQIGWVHLPIIWMDSTCGHDSFTVVTGWQSIQSAFQGLGQTSIRCRILSSQVHESRCALLAVASKTLRLPLLAGEMIRALNLLNRYYSHKQIADLSQSLLGQKLSVFRIQELLRAGQMQERWPDLLDAEQVTMRSVLQISSWDEATQKYWYQIFCTVKISSSKQTQMLRYFSEILARDNLTSQDFFSAPQVQNILHLDTDDAGQKGEMLRQYLTQKRYPVLEAEKARVQAHIMGLCLPKGIRVELPDNFESQEYGISLKFINKKDLMEKIAQLNAIASAPSWDGILARKGEEKFP